MRRILITILSAVVILALGALPALAGHNNQIPPHVAAGVFVGAATTGSISAPVGPACGIWPIIGPGPGVCDGVSTNWRLDIIAGAGGHYSPPGSGENPLAPTIDPILGIETDGAPNGFAVQVGTLGTTGIAGTLHYGTAGYGAWCGYSSGHGGVGPLTLTANVANVDPNLPATPNPYTIGLSDVGWEQSAATVIVFTGHVTSSSDSAVTHGTVGGVVSAIPPNPVLGGGSCLNGDAQTFTVVGVASAAWQDGA